MRRNKPRDSTLKKAIRGIGSKTRLPAPRCRALDADPWPAPPRPALPCPPSEAVISRLSPNLTVRIALGAARLGALYLATHAIGAFAGWRVLANTEAPAEADDEQENEDSEGDEDEDASDDAKRPASKIPVTKTQPDLRLSKITKFNVFCPTCAPVVEVPEELPLPSGVVVEDLEFPDAVHSQLPLALVATMEASFPGISLATISSAADGTTGVYAEGEWVMDGVELLAVDLGIVYLKAGSRVEYLQLTDEPPPVVKPPGLDDVDEAKEEEDDAPAKPGEIEGAAEAINCTGMSCTVERKFVNQLLANPAQLTRQGNARPYARDDLKGFRLSRIKSGTVPRMMGLRSGDVVTAINGQPLASLDGAMQLYTKLRSASNLTVDLVRNQAGARQELRLDITIVD